jgi:acetylornithine deacetylase/succinyl-diaminopimelate desuccinylase-like protein
MPLAALPLAYARANRARFVAELEDFIRFPSVSAQPKHAKDLQECAAWLADYLRQIGLEHVQLVSTPRHPIVYADWQSAPAQPTVLLYGHYDVQPPEPLHEWLSPPFEPTRRGNDLYGRGACDDKGQMFAHIKALEAYLQTEGTLPVNVKCLFEGEEEIGSPNLTPFLARHTHALAADVALMSDMPMLAPDCPAITYAMRGGLSLELELHGPQHDLHSGIFGGAIYNPLHALCDIVANLHDPEGRIAIPGFYDRVCHWSMAERDYMAQTGPSDAQLLHNAQVGTGWGECGYTLYERTTIRPTLTVTGIIGGYQGPGVKAIIPACATAKLNLRLVPEQDPHEIEHLFRQHIASIAPPAMSCTIRTHLTAKPALVNRCHPALRAAARAYHKGFGAMPVFLRSGGTIPVVHTFHELLGIPTVLMGFALPDDRMHAPNEKFHLPNFYRGIATSIHFLNEVSTQPERTSRLRQPHLQVTSPRQAQEERTGQL